MRYYPVCLDLQNRPALVVGGGAVAEGKAIALIEAGARVSLVSPAVTETLRLLVEAGAIDDWLSREFQEDDLTGMMLVIGATGDLSVNERVAEAAARRNILCNIVDQPRLCSYITPAVISRGRLQIAISTAGASPALAQRVKREIAELIGEEYGELLEIAAEMRSEAKMLLGGFEQRRDVMHEFVDSEALDWLRVGQADRARRIAEKALAAAMERDALTAEQAEDQKGN